MERLVMCKFSVRSSTETVEFVRYIAVCIPLGSCKALLFMNHVNVHLSVMAWLSLLFTNSLPPPIISSLNWGFTLIKITIIITDHTSCNVVQQMNVNVFISPQPVSLISPMVSIVMVIKHTQLLSAISLLEMVGYDRLNLMTSWAALLANHFRIIWLAWKVQLHFIMTGEVLHFFLLYDPPSRPPVWPPVDNRLVYLCPVCGRWKWQPSWDATPMLNLGTAKSACSH